MHQRILLYIIEILMNFSYSHIKCQTRQNFPCIIRFTLYSIVNRLYYNYVLYNKLQILPQMQTLMESL